MKKKFNIGYLIVFVIFGFNPTFAKQLVLLKNIKPTHIESVDKYVPLELVKVIEDEIDDENFFAKPMTVVPGDDGSFFVYDMLLLKIFKFDEDFELAKVFLNKGQGPSEIQKKTDGINKIYFTKNGFLTVAAPFNKKIIVFDRNGNYVKSIRMPFPGNIRFSPVLDAEGNIYTISGSNPGIDVLDKNAMYKYTLLNHEDYRYYINHKPDLDKNIIETGKGIESTHINTAYDILENGRLVIYVKNSSTIHLFNGNKLHKKFNVWPKKAMGRHQASIKKLEKRLNSKNFEINLFDHFFVDKDNNTNLYLSGSYQEREKKKVGMIYNIDLNGNLICVYFADRRVRFHAKGNNYFYGLYKGNVLVYKIKK